MRAAIGIIAALTFLAFVWRMRVAYENSKRQYEASCARWEELERRRRRQQQEHEPEATLVGLVELVREVRAQPLREPGGYITTCGELKPETRAALVELAELMHEEAPLVDAPATDPPTTQADQPVRCHVCRRVLRGKNSIHHGAGRRCRARIKSQRERDDAAGPTENDIGADGQRGRPDVPGAAQGEPGAAAEVQEPAGPAGPQ